MKRSSALVCARLFLALFTFAVAACGSAPTPDVATSAESLDPQLVTMEGEVSNRYVKTGERGELFVRLRIAARAQSERHRGPVVVTLVIDTSGSMEGKPIEDARAASLAMVDALDAGDRLSVVTFDSKERVLLASATISADNREELKKPLRAMKAQGTTDMARGLALGLEQARSAFDASGVNRIVLLGDGVPNDSTRVGALADDARAAGITITALGLGPDYDETLMGKIAQRSGGKFHYVDDSQKVGAFFKDEVMRLQGAIAKNAHLRFTPGPGVRIEEIVGQPGSRDGSAMVLGIGDLSKGDSRDIVVRLSTEARKTTSAVELLDASLTFDDATASAGRLERSLFLGAKSTTEQADLDKGRNPEVELSAALVQAAATTVAALETARRGSPDAARTMLLEGALRAETQSKRTPSPELTKQIETMRGLATDLPKPAARSGSATPVHEAGSFADPFAAASPAPAPQPGAAAPVMASPAVAPAPAKVRAAHDDAMQYLQ